MVDLKLLRVDVRVAFWKEEVMGKIKVGCFVILKNMVFDGGWRREFLLFEKRGEIRWWRGCGGYGV